MIHVGGRRGIVAIGEEVNEVQEETDRQRQGAHDIEFERGFR